MGVLGSMGPSVSVLDAFMMGGSSCQDAGMGNRLGRDVPVNTPCSCKHEAYFSFAPC